MNYPKIAATGAVFLLAALVQVAATGPMYVESALASPQTVSAGIQSGDVPAPEAQLASPAVSSAPMSAAPILRDLQTVAPDPAISPVERPAVVVQPDATPFSANLTGTAPANNDVPLTSVPVTNDAPAAPVTVASIVLAENASSLRSDRSGTTISSTIAISATDSAGNPVDASDLVLDSTDPGRTFSPIRLTRSGGYATDATSTGPLFPAFTVTVRDTRTGATGSIVINDAPAAPVTVASPAVLTGAARSAATGPPTKPARSSSSTSRHAERWPSSE